MLNPRLKLFVVRKYVYATSAAEALRAEKTVVPDEVWLDDDWKKANAAAPPPGKAIGFKKP